MNIAVIGSRDFGNLPLVWGVITTLPQRLTILSGGSRGVDQVAVKAAKSHGLSVIECLPDLRDLAKSSPAFEYTRRYYDRNQRIVDLADKLIAFTDRSTGGTWDAIRRAQRKGIAITIYNSCGESKDFPPQLSLF